MKKEKSDRSREPRTTIRNTWKHEMIIRKDVRLRQKLAIQKAGQHTEVEKEENGTRLTFIENEKIQAR